MDTRILSSGEGFYSSATLSYKIKMFGALHFEKEAAVTATRRISLTGWTSAPANLHGLRGIAAVALLLWMKDRG